MSAKASQLFSRRLVSSVRTSQYHSRHFATFYRQSAKESPSISNINANDAEGFNVRQKKFRDDLAARKKEADAQSSPSSLPGSSLSAGASRVVTRNSGGRRVLRSYLSSKAGEAETGKTGSEAQESGKDGKKDSVMRTIIYGTEAGRQMEEEIETSFSQVLARGKYVHSIVMHDVKPDKVDEYVELVGNWYPKVAANPRNNVHLVGSWRTEVGDCDTFVHIWEYRQYSGYHASLHNIWHHPDFEAFDKKLKTCIKSKRVSLMQEFSFWPTTPPRKLGGLFELRAYTLHPGNLLEWETHWRKGLEARREVMEGVGAWFVQIGDLNTVYHLWQFPDLEHRRIAREKSWSVEGWGDTVHHTVPLIQTMHSRIMVPMEWSPVA